jgi:hypothetical protein
MILTTFTVPLMTEVPEPGKNADTWPEYLDVARGRGNTNVRNLMG